MSRDAPHNLLVVCSQGGARVGWREREGLLLMKSSLAKARRGHVCRCEASDWLLQQPEHTSKAAGQRMGEGSERNCESATMEGLALPAIASTSFLLRVPWAIHEADRKLLDPTSRCQVLILKAKQEKAGRQQRSSLAAAGDARTRATEQMRAVVRNGVRT